METFEDMEKWFKSKTINLFCERIQLTLKSTFREIDYEQFSNIINLFEIHIPR